MVKVEKGGGAEVKCVPYCRGNQRRYLFSMLHRRGSIALDIAQPCAF